MVILDKTLKEKIEGCVQWYKPHTFHSRKDAENLFLSGSLTLIRCYKKSKTSGDISNQEQSRQSKILGIYQVPQHWSEQKLFLLIKRTNGSCSGCDSWLYLQDEVGYEHNRRDFKQELIDRAELMTEIDIIKEIEKYDNELLVL